VFLANAFERGTDFAAAPGGLKLSHIQQHICRYGMFGVYPRW
jgi:hypothetical protein